MEGKYGQAEALFTQTLNDRRRVLGREHPDTLGTLADIASMYQREGKVGLAETYATQALTGRRRVLGSQNADTMKAATDLALACVSQRKFTDGEPLAREAVDFGRKKQSADWQRFRAESVLGASLLGQKKYSEAEPLLLEGYQGMLAQQTKMEAADRYYLTHARDLVVELYHAWGKAEKAVEWAKK